MLEGLSLYGAGGEWPRTGRGGCREASGMLGSTVAVLRQYKGVDFQYHGTATVLPWYCYGTGMVLARYCHCPSESKFMCYK